MKVPRISIQNYVHQNRIAYFLPGVQNKHSIRESSEWLVVMVLCATKSRKYPLGLGNNRWALKVNFASFWTQCYSAYLENADIRTSQISIVTPVVGEVAHDASFKIVSKKNKKRLGTHDDAAKGRQCIPSRAGSTLSSLSLANPLIIALHSARWHEGKALTGSPLLVLRRPKLAVVLVLLHVGQYCRCSLVAPRSHYHILSTVSRGDGVSPRVINNNFSGSLGIYLLQ